MTPVELRLREKIDRVADERDRLRTRLNTTKKALQRARKSAELWRHRAEVNAAEAEKLRRELRWAMEELAQGSAGGRRARQGALRA